MAAPGVRSRHLPRRKLAFLALALSVTAATPAPSPSLDTLLAPPPAGYVEDTESTGQPIGAFDARSYATYLGSDDPSPRLTELARDGFVKGYGKSWSDQGTSRGLAEFVVAFSGGAGARRWLASTEVADKRDDLYKGPIAVSGLGTGFGVRYVDDANHGEADVVSFVKGNDYFLVGFVSAGEDLSEPAIVQARTQFAFAPVESIPSAQWPENTRSFPFLPVFAMFFAAAVAITIVAVLRRPRPAS